MTDKLYDISYDTGDKVIQCGRHNDIFKLWLQWRAKGTEGFEQMIDKLMELTSYQVHRIKAQPEKFHLIMEPECVNVSFWYIPKRLRGVPHTSDKEAEMGKVRIFNFTFLSLNLDEKHSSIIKLINSFCLFSHLFCFDISVTDLPNH